MKEIHLYAQGQDPYRQVWNGITIVVHHTEAPPVVVIETGSEIDTGSGTTPKPVAKPEPIKVSRGGGGPIIAAVPMMAPSDDPRPYDFSAMSEPPLLSGMLDKISADPAQSGLIEFLLDMPSSPHNDLSAVMTGISDTTASDVILHVTTSREVSDG